MNHSLKHKTIKGVSWSFVDNIANSGISFLVGLVLARLLSPEEFGIIGMITIFIAIANSIVDSGFSSALIRKIDVKDIDYNTVFYFNLVVGIFFYIILFLASPSIASFFSEPLLLPVTRVMGLILIINTFGTIQRTIYVKDVDFKTQTKVSIIASIASGVIGIGMACYGYGVWSLVGQQLSRQILNSFFLWFFSHWRPAWEFSQKSFKELFGFGSKLLVSGLIDTIYKNIYYLVIGRFYSAAQLGQYTRAEQFNTIFSSNLTSVIQRVSYPILSEIQTDSERLKGAYRKIIKSTMLVTFACMLGLAAISKSLIVVLIGYKWLEAASFLQIICLSGMLYPLHAINLNILLVCGRPDICLKLEVIKKIIATLPIVLGIFWGIEYMLWGSVVTSFIAYFLNSHYSANLIKYSPWSQIKDLAPSFIISLIVSFIMWSVNLIILPEYITLILQCAIGLSLAFFLYEKMHLAEYLEIKKILFLYTEKIKNGKKR